MPSNPIKMMISKIKIIKITNRVPKLVMLDWISIATNNRLNRLKKLNLVHHRNR
jgi:hypothetical protein